ncbi:hypothetical protein N7326_05300 [Corynebacterium sp. ES2794-CONJ1]|uniref:hypothetical protein n=1 Tax=Corynebacterium sp. ES2794-CONJ1 TaxID=2980553 RepID=UPI0021DB6A1F|nr:hypothetical protein [Corynebacterium sp. ES2794-CONJ1]MCU9519291.1 hypothetical protein [Corynebacterium sp. ES2794-CONJ1]
MLRIPNIDVCVYHGSGLLSKGYLFEHRKYRSVIIGSSNLSRSALLENEEWKPKVSASPGGGITALNSATINRPLDTRNGGLLTEEWIADYERTGL